LEEEEEEEEQEQVVECAVAMSRMGLHQFKVAADEDEKSVQQKDPHQKKVVLEDVGVLENIK
jgi:hypothetical protein